MIAAGRSRFLPLAVAASDAHEPRVGSRVFLVLELDVWPVRATSAFCRLLCLEGVSVRGVEFLADRVVVGVALRRTRLVCPLCDFSTGAREGVQDHESSWRHLDLGVSLSRPLHEDRFVLEGDDDRAMLERFGTDASTTRFPAVRSADFGTVAVTPERITGLRGRRLGLRLYADTLSSAPKSRNFESSGESWSQPSAYKTTSWSRLWPTTHPRAP